MISVYKLEKYKTYSINSEIFSSISGTVKTIRYAFTYHWNYSNNFIVAPIPKTTLLKNLTNDGTNSVINMEEEIKNRTGNSIGSKLYFHPNCTIPRAKVTQKYTRVIKTTSADNCVIPELRYPIKTNRAAIFINKSKNKIYYCPVKRRWQNNQEILYAPSLCLHYNVGTPLLEIYPLLANTMVDTNGYTYGMSKQEAQEAWNDFLDSTLIFYGHCAELVTKDVWVADLLYGKLHDVVKESTILTTLGSEENKFDKEIFSNIKQMLESTDSNIVGIGLKTLAELDYEKYKNTAILLLCSSKGCKWLKNEMKHNTSVKYMLNFLNLRNYAVEHYSSTINEEDFKLLQDTINLTFEEEINIVKANFLKRFPFVNLTFNYDITTSPLVKDLFGKNNETE